MRDFLQFIKQQGVVGLAIGFMLGGAVTSVVTSLVNDIVYPLLNIVLGRTKGWEKEVLQFGQIKLAYGHFFSVLLNFVIIATVVYLLVRLLRLELPGKKK